MRIKLDQNISQYLRDDLTSLNHDIDTVVDEGLSGADDPAVLKAATAHERILFTLDVDFLDLKMYRRKVIGEWWSFVRRVRARSQLRSS